MSNRLFRPVLLAAVLMTLTLGGCAQYVKQADFNAAIVKLQATDQKQQQQLDQQQQQINALSQQMQTAFAKYDTQITQLQGRIRVDTVSHFAFNSSKLGGQDKQILDSFARVIRTHHPNVLITAEGFADPAGSMGYNQRLGMQRARAVRSYLLSQGLSAHEVRAVSYGKLRNRQVIPGAWGPQGGPNRRVSLVIDFVAAGGGQNSHS